MLIGEDIAVLGGGIAGLALARALAGFGAKVTIYERAPEIAEVGAGLQLSPNGRRVLDALTLSPEKQAMRSRGVRLVDGYSGRGVAYLDLLRARPEEAFLLIHRADLIDLLVAGLTDLGVELKLGHGIEKIEETPEKVTLHFANGGAASHAMIIGADGLHSKMRAQLNGPATPFFTRQVAWRATVPARGDEPAEARVHLAKGQHVVSYPLRDRSLINIVAVEEQSQWREEGWHLTGSPEDLLFHFDQFGDEVTELLSRVEHVSHWGLFRHKVAENWGQASGNGRLALVGDAAHPTLPFMAQGANLALEDAWVLANCLAQLPRDQALQAYHAKRFARVERVLKAANDNARNYHLGGPVRHVAHAGLRLLNRVKPDAMVEKFSWLYDYDVTKDV